MYHFFELCQLLSIRAAQNVDLNKFNVTQKETVCLKQPISSKSSVYCYAYWSNNAKVEGVVPRSYLALCMTNGMLLFYRLSNGRGDRPVLRQLPWYNHPSKQVAALCFDPSGSWVLIATKDATLYVLPARKFLDPSAETLSLWSADDATEIKLQGRRAMPTQIRWWRTRDGQEIAIVGNELGEISFVNLVLRKEVGGTYINVGISELELINDENNGFTYVLLTGTNDVQWQLILEQQQADYQWPLEKQEASTRELKRSAGSSSSLSMLSCLSSSEDRPNSASKDKDTRPRRLIQYAGHTHLKGERTRNRTYVSGKYAPTGVLSVHGPDLNVVPLFVYKLPADATRVLLADRLIYALTTDCVGLRLRIVCTELASTTIDGNKDFDPGSELQSFVLNSEETVLGVCARLSAEGCVLLTDRAVYVLRQRTTPEDFFLEMILREGDYARADRFGRIFGLNASALYEKAADRKLSEGHVTSAVRLYQFAKCSHIRSVANFATHGYVSELLSYVNVLFATRSPDFSPRDLKHFSNIALYCFIQQCLELRLGNNVVKQNFREFLRTNQHYDEQLAVRLLSSNGAYDLLLELGEWRGLMPNVLNEILPKEEIAPCLDRDVCFPKAIWVDSKTEAVLRDHGFGDSLSLRDNDNFLGCLLSDALPSTLGMRPDLLRRHLSLTKSLVPLWEERPELTVALLGVYDPSHPALALLFRQFRHRRRANNEFADLSGGFDFATDQLSTDDADLPADLVKTFLSLLSLSNKGRSHSECRAYDPSLVEAMSEAREDGQVPGDSQKLRLPKHPVNVGCGYAHAAAVVDGTLYTWGRSKSGCLGRGPVRREWLPAEPVLKPPALRVLSVACGAAHTLAMTDVGIFSWGSNSYGQLGIGVEGGAANRRCYPTCVAALTEMDVVSVACGQYHSMALTADGSPLSFGWGVHGQLGHGNAQNVCMPRPIEAMKGSPVSRISCGYGHSLLLTAKGEVYAFGCGAFGQMATGQTAKENKPIRVELSEAVILVAAGYFHNVAVSTSGKVYTWGCNPQTLRMRAQLSRRERALRHVPVDEGKPDGCSESAAVCDPLKALGLFTPGEVNVEAVSSQIVQATCGANHSVLLTADGGCFAWGRNYGGQLGLDSRKEQMAVALIDALNGCKIVQADCGADFTVLADADGKMFGFGMDDFRQIFGATDQCRSAESSAPTSPAGKVYTVRTNKRVVHIKSPTRSSVYKPIVLNALPVAHDPGFVESTNNEIFRACRAFKLRFQHEHERPYSDAVLHKALEQLNGFYDGPALEGSLESDGNVQAAAKVALMDGRHEASFSFNLKSIAEDESLESEKRAKAALELLEIYVRLVAEDADRLKALLELVMVFWSEHGLPTQELEDFLAVHLHQFLGPLSALMFSNSWAEEDGQLNLFLSKISNRFCMTLVGQVVQKVSSGCPRLELLDVLAGMVRVDVPDNAPLNLWMPGSSGMAGTDSQGNLLGELSSGGIKRAIDLPTSEVQEILRGSKGAEKTSVLVFTCGHHYPMSAVRNTVLPRFEELLSETVPEVSKMLAEVYRTPGFQPMACPKCFIEGVRQEETTQVAPSDCFA